MPRAWSARPCPRISLRSAAQSLSPRSREQWAARRRPSGSQCDASQASTTLARIETLGTWGADSTKASSASHRASCGSERPHETRASLKRRALRRCGSPSTSSDAARRSTTEGAREISFVEQQLAQIEQLVNQVFVQGLGKPDGLDVRRMRATALIRHLKHLAREPQHLKPQRIAECS